MTETIELARVLVSLWPEASHLDEGVEKIADKAEKRFGRSGKVMGQQLASGLDEGTKRAESGLRKVEAASKKVQVARKAEADAAGRLVVAETRLEDVRKKSSVSAGQRKAAEESVERARRAQVLAADNLTRALRDQRRAQQDSTAGHRESAAAVNVLGGALGRAGSAADRLGAGGNVLGAMLGRLSSGATGLGAALGTAETGAVALGAAAGAVAGAGLAALGAGAAAAMKQLYDLGESYDEVFDRLRLKTGETGPALEGLKQATMDIASQVPLTTGEIGSMTAQVNKALGQTGDGLVEVTTNIANLSRIAEEPIDVRQLGKVFKAYSLKDAKEQVAALNSFKNASQSTQIPVNELIGLAAKGGPAMRQLGMDLGKATAMMGVFEEAGMEPEKIIAPLTKGLGTLAKKGQSGPEALRTLTNEIQRLIDVGDEAGAINLGNKLFGGRGGLQFVDAIRRGVFDVKKLDEALSHTGTTIQEDVDATDDFAQQWQILKNKAAGALQPLSSEVFDFTNEALGGLGDWVSEHQSDLVKFFSLIAEGAVDAGRHVIIFAADMMTAVGDIIAAAGDVAGTWMQLRGVWDQVLGNDDKAQQNFKRAQDFFAWQSGPDSLFEKAKKWKDAANSGADELNKKLDEAGNQTAEALKFTEKLGKAKVSLGDDKTTVYIDSNAPEVTEKLAKIGLQVKELPDGKFEVNANTEEGQKTLDAWRQKQGGKKLEVPVTVDTKQAQEDWDNFKKNITAPAPASSPPPGDWSTLMLPPPAAPRARGGIYDVWDSVASFAGGKLPRTAMFQPPVSGAGLVQWAEPSTGGEAFIPIRGGKRSIDIWAKTGQMLGVFDQGGFNNVSQDELNRMGGGTVNLSILRALRESNPSAVLTSAKTDHGVDGGYHPKGMAIDVDPSRRNLDALWSMRDQLAQIIFDDPQKVWYNVNGEHAEGQAARRIYGESTMKQHGDHIHVAALHEIGSYGQMPGGGRQQQQSVGLGQLTPESSPDDVASAILGEATRRGYSQDEAVAVLSTAMQESGLNPKASGGGGAWHGVFQQDTSYVGRDDPNKNIGEFFNRLDEKRSSGGSSKDIWKDIFWLQQAPGAASAEAAYSGGRQAYKTEIQSKSGAASAAYSRLGGGGGGISGYGYQRMPATPGYDDDGTAGYYRPDAKQVREAQERVIDADQRVKDADLRVKEAEAKQRELTAAATDLEVMQAQNAVDKAKNDAAKARREAGDARDDLGEAQRGKFTANKGSKGSGPDGQSFAKDMLSGAMDALGFDGEIFSNPMDWGIWKLFTGGANYLGSLAKNAFGGPQRGNFPGLAGGPLGGEDGGLGGMNFGDGGGISSAGDTIASVLPQVSDFLPNSQTQAPPSVDQSINITGNVGMDPAALKSEIHTEQNARSRTYASGLPRP